MPKPYPKEFRDDVVRVARAREAGVTLVQVAKDFQDPRDQTGRSCAANSRTSGNPILGADPPATDTPRRDAAPRSPAPATDFAASGHAARTTRSS